MGGGEMLKGREGKEAKRPDSMLRSMLAPIKVLATMCACNSCAELPPF